jgi:prevent-host-death family protein
MTEVGIDILKDQLSDYLERAREGERILITERGRSIALLIPSDGSEASQRAWELVEAGVASWSGGKPRGARQKPRTRGRSASSVVLDQRRAN